MIRDILQPIAKGILEFPDRINYSGSSNFLSNFTNPIAAYSLQDLTGDNLNVVNVERSSDGTSRDFTATEVIDGTLVSFCGAGNGIVNTLYDQTGNGNNLTQATDSNKPFVVRSGSLVTLDGNPSIEFITSDYLTTANFTLLSQPVSAFSVYKANEALTSFVFYGNDTTNVVSWGLVPASGYNLFAGTTYYAGTTTLTKEYVSLFYNGTNSQSFINGVETHATGTTVGTNGIDGISMGGTNTGTFYLRGYIDLLVLCDGDERTNRTKIESKINSFFFDIDNSPVNSPLTVEDISFENSVDII